MQIKSKMVPEYALVDGRCFADALGVCKRSRNNLTTSKRYKAVLSTAQPGYKAIVDSKTLSLSSSKVKT